MDRRNIPGIFSIKINRRQGFILVMKNACRLFKRSEIWLSLDNTGFTFESAT